MSESYLGQILDINTMLKYQDGAVVSRVILKKETGNVTVFAFDKGQELSEHTAPFDAIVQVVDGNAMVSIGGKSNALQAGQMIIMPANIPHALVADEKFKMILTMLKK